MTPDQLKRNSVWGPSTGERKREEVYFLALSFLFFLIVKIEFSGSEYTCAFGVYHQTHLATTWRPDCIHCVLLYPNVEAVGE